MRFEVEIVGKTGIEYNYSSGSIPRVSYSDDCWENFLEDNKLSLSNNLSLGSDQATTAYLTVTTIYDDGNTETAAKYNRIAFNSKYKV